MPPSLADFEPLRLAIGAEAAAFQNLYWRHRDAYDLDAIDTRTYFQEMAGASLSPEQVQRLAALDCQMWGRVNPVMVEWVRLLRPRGLKTAILSNMSRCVSEYFRRTAEWVKLFDHLCFSAELGMGKPGAAIYHACLKALNVPASQALFVDDREVNVGAARALGMNAILFRSVEDLQPHLEVYGLAESLAAARQVAGTEVESAPVPGGIQSPGQRR